MTGAVVAALLVAGSVATYLRERARARRADILAYVYHLQWSTDGDWVRSSALSREFGQGVYHHLRVLVDRRRLERREGPTDAETLRMRGGRPAVFFRLPVRDA